MLEVCGSSLLWRFLPVGGVGRVACQGFLVREACIGLVGFSRHKYWSGLPKCGNIQQIKEHDKSPVTQTKEEGIGSRLEKELKKIVN